MKMPELKPCPFCGGRAYVEKRQRAYVQTESTHVSYVRCMQCGARAERFDHRDYADSCRRACAFTDAVDAWNRRFSDENA